MPQPHVWADLGLARPRRPHDLLGGPLYVRGFNEGTGTTAASFADAEFSLSVDVLIDEPAHPVAVGATVVFIGYSSLEGERGIAVWEPARLWWLGDPNRHQHRDAISIFATDNPRTVFRDELPPDIRTLVLACADDGRPLDEASADTISDFWATVR